jgi:parallel beta-helix repeat protein
MWDSTWTSHNHQIIGNTIRNNTYGVGLWGNTRNNHVYHNTFSNNTCQAVVDTGLQTNYWNGNYWSDYAGTDADHDGIGDTPYTIDAYNTDHYPLMKPYLPAPSISFSPHEIYLDEQTRNFTVSVNIENLQASHKLGIVSVRLEYNSALISLVSDVRGDFLKDFDRLFLIETSFPYILLVNTNKTITDFPEGNGTIWVCSFEVRALVETTIRLISEAADVEGNVLIQNSSNYCHLIVAQAFDEWVPWVPNPDQLELHYWQRGSTSYVNVSVHAESMAYEVSSWGIPAIDGSNIAANAEAWHWTGYIVLIYDPRTYNHTYDLGNLPTGDYVFNFRVWGHLVEKITFSVVHTVPRLGIDPYYCYVRDGYATFNITIEGIKESDHLVAIQFRLRWYDPSVLAPSEATEGPFMQDSRWNLYGTYFFVSEDEVCDYCGFRILIGDLLLPKQQDGNWTVFPYGGGVFATVRFQAFSNVTSLGHIWTRVDLQSAYAFSNLMEDIDLSPSGVWVCLLEEAAADVVMDGQVDMWDLATVAKHFGCSLGDSRWMFRADVNGDGRIDMKDLGFVANQWGNNFEVPQLAY